MVNVSGNYMDTNYTATTLTVLVAAIVAVGAFSGGAVGAEELSVSVTQADDGSATVTVTDNETAVGNATVDVETAEDENVTYSGTGSYTTDANGTVGLPAPEENVSINVTATDGNRSGTTSATLTAVSTNETNEANETNETTTNESFGQQVSAKVFSLQNDTDMTGGLGPSLATWVVANNPGNAPDHAGPPENLTRGPPENVTQGPPEHAGPPENKTQGGSGNGGPPADKGPSDGKNKGGNGGPPDHAGPE